MAASSCTVSSLSQVLVISEKSWFEDDANSGKNCIFLIIEPKFTWNSDKLWADNFYFQYTFWAFWLHIFGLPYLRWYYTVWLRGRWLRTDWRYIDTQRSRVVKSIVITFSLRGSFRHGQQWLIFSWLAIMDGGVKCIDAEVSIFWPLQRLWKKALIMNVLRSICWLGAR